MCGRFTLTTEDQEFLIRELGVAIVEEFVDYRPRFNIAPTDEHWIVRMKREDRELLHAKWGLVNSWAKDAKQAARQINARAERVAESPAFRGAFEERRCIVPADGYFEWVGAKTDRRPVWFHRGDGGLLLFAGLYESWQREPGIWQRTFTIITTDANETAARIHDRMPVILDPARVDDWLAPNTRPQALREMLSPAPDGLLVPSYVSTRANSVKNDDPGVLEPAML
ncbi:MAG: SOS response-associated peptidase [Tepidiformaceae bacterium]